MVLSAQSLSYAALLFAATISTAAQAESINPVLDDKFTFRLGGLYNSLEGTVTVARPPLPVTPVDIDNVLGIDTDQSSPWASFKWRFRERWSLNFQFDRFDQSGGAIVGDPFNLDGQPYPVGAVINTEFRADAYILDVSYNFWQGSNYEAGLGLGLHAYDLEVGIEGFLRLEAIDTVLFESTDETLLAPVPNLRGYYTYAFNEKTSLSLNAGWLSLTYEDYDGSFIYVKAQAEHRFSKRWGVGLGAQYTEMNLEHDSGDGDFEEFEIDFTGALVFITYSF